MAPVGNQPEWLASSGVGGIPVTPVVIGSAWRVSRATAGAVAVLLRPAALERTGIVLTNLEPASASTGAIVASTLNSGGAGYAALDTFTVDGGGSPASGVVDTVDGGGAVLTYHLVTQGAGYVPTVGATTTTGGGGAGLTLDIVAVSPNVLYLGPDATVTPATGYPVPPGASLTMTHQAEIWGITTGAAVAGAMAEEVVI